LGWGGEPLTTHLVVVTFRLGGLPGLGLGRGRQVLLSGTSRTVAPLRLPEWTVGTPKHQPCYTLAPAGRIPRLGPRARQRQTIGPPGTVASLRLPSHAQRRGRAPTARFVEFTHTHNHKPIWVNRDHVRNIQAVLDTIGLGPVGIQDSHIRQGVIQALGWIDSF
jgi:hypothetical protein